MSSTGGDVADLRQRLSTFATRERKLVGGLFALMIRSPERVRDREWVGEQIATLALLSRETDDAEAASPQDAVADVEAYVQTHAAPVLEAALLLFQHVGADLAQKNEPFGFEDAMAQAMTYFPNG